MSPFDETRARRYLLGQMSEEETASLEAEYFADGEALERVWEVENDLVDAFVADELAPDDRTAFETHYLASPLHRDRVATARVLRAATLRTAAPRRRVPAWSVWLPLAAGLVLLLTWWAWPRRTAPTPTIARAEATPTPAATAAPSPAASTSPPKTSVAAFALSPLLMRSGQPAPVLRVAPGTDELKLTLEGERPEGVASDARLPFVVKTVEGETVARGYVVPGADVLGVARVPADRVPPGDYILAVRPSDKEGRLLTAREGADDVPLRQYFFRVIAR